MNLESYYKAVEIVLTVLLGLSVGSFLNVVIYRLPNKMSLSNPPSHCPKCDYKLRWYDNIPVLSYIILGGRCRSCKERISPRYITVEIFNAVLWLGCYFVFGFNGWREILMTCCGALACSVALCVALIDLEHKIIFDRFQIIIAVLGLIFTLADKNASIIINIISGFAVGIIFYLIGFVVSRKVGQEALGGGDIKFGFVSGLFLGWQKFILMSLISSVTASVTIIIANRKNGNDGNDGNAAENTEASNENENLSEEIIGEEIITEQAPKKEYPFGPFLVLGFIIALLFGSKIISSYFGLLGIDF